MKDDKCTQFYQNIWLKNGKRKETTVGVEGGFVLRWEKLKYVEREQVNAQEWGFLGREKRESKAW